MLSEAWAVKCSSRESAYYPQTGRKNMILFFINIKWIYSGAEKGLKSTKYLRTFNDDDVSRVEGKKGFKLRMERRSAEWHENHRRRILSFSVSSGHAKDGGSSGTVVRGGKKKRNELKCKQKLKARSELTFILTDIMKFFLYCMFFPPFPFHYDWRPFDITLCTHFMQL